MTRIDQNDIFYHIYPLGACAAPRENDFSSLPQARIRQLEGWLDHIQALGASALYLGPVFESGTHGYDTADYYHLDRRLGSREDLGALSAKLHGRGMKLVLDGVFNHVGRHFWAFRDLLEKRQASAYQDWFTGVNFDQRSPFGDPFSYHAWNGHFDLVKLNLANQGVLAHLFGAIRMWKEEFKIDGIRLDAADSLSPEFMRQLRNFVNELDPDLWLMGEVIHGDYRAWANPEMLHATTNYELYKSLYSSLNDGNFFELAYSLNREFGEGGIYAHLPTMYNFADNHDVSRIASRLGQKEQLGMLYALLFTFPGLPSIYYGSEFGFEGQKQSEDWNLRPALELENLQDSSHSHDLRGWLSKLAQVRQESPTLRFGDYRGLHTASRQLAFLRSFEGNRALVTANSSDQAVSLTLDLPEMAGWNLVDALSEGERFVVEGGKLTLRMAPNQVRILGN